MLTIYRYKPWMVELCILSILASFGYLQYDYVENLHNNPLRYFFFGELITADLSYCDKP